MKYKPQDMLDQLKTGEDRLAKAEELKAELREAGYKVRVSRRKLASGEKFYFQITMPDDQSHWDRGTRSAISHLIYHYFPDANLTSGGSMSVTYAEY